MKTAEERAKALVDWFVAVDIDNKDDALAARIEEAITAFAEERVEEAHRQDDGLRTLGCKMAKAEARAFALEEAARAVGECSDCNGNPMCELCEVKVSRVLALKDKP